MAKSKDDIEAYLLRLSRRYELSDDGTFIISAGADQPPLALRVDPPVCVVQVAIGDAPSGDAALEAKFFRKLLELNATDLVHVAYALENGSVVLTAALELENLDLNELEAVLAGIDMALAQHVPVLREMAQKQS